MLGSEVGADLDDFRHSFNRSFLHTILDLVVHESSRSKGIGAKLLPFAENFTKEKNCKVLRLSTGIQNERGKSFYEKLGWQLTALAYTKKI